MFNFQHHNRLQFPQKHILVVEDNLSNQKRFVNHFAEVFDPEGDVQFSFVPGALMAAGIIHQYKVDLIILDHDLPCGTGTNLLNWMREYKINIPVITASGIPQNNAWMMQTGATYLFQKEEVISGKADALIKKVLYTPSTIAESYPNHLYHNHYTRRWWLNPQIMIGGSINDAEDYQHLKSTYGIEHVINLETEHSDVDKNIDNLCEVQVPDNGQQFPAEVVHKIIDFAKAPLKEGKKIYVHCQMGSSRSPAGGYCLLRSYFNLSKEDALETVANARPDANKYGHHEYHESYINSIEIALKQNVGLAENYVNTLSPNKPLISRYWITPNLLVGGNICDRQDLNHLVDDFGIGAVINVDGHDDAPYSDRVKLCQIHVLDNGDSFSKETISNIINFTKENMDKTIYVHCHLGFSRSPHFAYTILRSCYNMSQEEAYNKVKECLPSEAHRWGFGQHTVNYVKSIEEALA